MIAEYSEAWAARFDKHERRSQLFWYLKPFALSSVEG